jgi:hypothetical protein
MYKELVFLARERGYRLRGTTSYFKNTPAPSLRVVPLRYEAISQKIPMKTF